MLEYESESAIVAFSSELGGESPASDYMRVCERGFALGAYERWAVFSFTYVDVYSPCYLQRVPSSLEGCC